MPFDKFKNWAKRKIYEIVFEQDDEHWIALSFSIGLFFGFIPLMGIQFFPLLLIIFLAKLNKVSTIVGHLMMNMFTFPIVYAFSFLVGTQVLGEGIDIIFNPKALTWAYLLEVYKPLFVGCMIVGLITSAATYFIVRKAVHSYRKMHRAKLEAAENAKKSVNNANKAAGKNANKNTSRVKNTKKKKNLLKAVRTNT